MSLAIFFLFCGKIFRGRCDSYESHRPLLWTIYFPTAHYHNKGKVERNFKTLRSRFLNVLDPEELAGIEDLNSRLADYINRHNTTVHSATGQTPQDRYMADIRFVKLAKSREWLDECFMNRVVRLVRSDSTVTIDQTFYDVPMEFMRTRVEIRFLPDDMEHAYVFYEGNYRLEGLRAEEALDLFITAWNWQEPLGAFLMTTPS